MGCRPALFLWGLCPDHVVKDEQDATASIRQAGERGGVCTHPNRILMPKTITGLWPHVTQFDNLHRSYLEARRSKRYRPDVLRFTESLEANLFDIQDALTGKTWAPGPQREFVVREPKLRAIQAPPFADRVVHHALVGVVGPHFERRFISDSYACRQGKGTQRAVARVQHFLRVAKRNHGDGIYVMQADISRYFASIRYDVLMREAARVISDPDVLWLWRRIVAGYGHENGVGLPVGALTSQLGANIVLNRLDHVAKDDMGLRHYVRYMDDFIAVLPTKHAAQEVMQVMEAVVGDLGLHLNPKTAVHPWQRGVDFCGYRIWPTHILPRKRNIKRARADFRELASQFYHGEVELERVRQRVASFLAYAKHCNAQRTVEGVLGDLVLVPGLRGIVAANAGNNRQFVSR